MKKQQQTVHFTRSDSALWLLLGFALSVLALGYGYFWGRYEQIQLNRSVLKAIPDVNCAQESY